ncbi:ABC transporter permease [Cetobacterium sp.]|uniref:ABC transporter permease n=1 Tax=Cetobacterium sp. TaxID=2071632 RepID=UPI003F3E46B6
MERLKTILKSREITPLYMLMVLFIIVGIINPTFFSYQNIASTLYGSSLYIILSIGISFVIMTGEIDVSIGSTLGLCATVSGVMIRDGYNVFVVLLVVILIGGFIGLINGIGIVDFEVSSIIMTLGMLGIVRGAIFLITKGRWVENLPASFKELSQKNIIGINEFFLMSFLLVIIMHFYLSKTPQGGYFKAVGDNQNGANLVGIPVKKTKRLAFVYSGLFSGIAALMFASRTGFIAPISGNGYEMTIIAGCVLGGISLTGGVGSIIGSSLGVIIMASLSKVLVFMGFSSDLNNTITGALLVVIVVSDTLLQKYSISKNRKVRLNNRVKGETVNG